MPNYPVSPEIYDQSIPQFITAKNVVLNFLEKNNISDKTNITILDACCGTGNLVSFLGNRLPLSTVVGLDNATNMIAFAKKEYSNQDNISFLCSDLTVSDPSLKKFADLIVCSWGVSHIPQEKQKQFCKNLQKYLKYEGQLVVLFPVLGSELSTVINEIVSSDKWNQLFIQLQTKRVSYSAQSYNQLLGDTGFVNCKTEINSEKIVFKNEEELRNFVITSIARYLPFLYGSNLDDFTNEVISTYQTKVPELSYTVQILSASAKRMCFNRNLGINNTRTEKQKQKIDDVEIPTMPVKPL